MSNIKEFEVIRFGQRANITIDELENLYKFTNEQLTAYRKWIDQQSELLSPTDNSNYSTPFMYLPFEWIINGYHLQHLRQTGKDVIVPTTSKSSPAGIHEAYIKPTIKTINKICKYNDELMQHARAGRIRKNKDRFFNLIDKFDSNNIQKLNIEYIDNSTPRATCQRCGITIKQSRLETHQKTSRCTKVGYLKAIKDRGFVPLYSRDIIRLAEQRLIPSELIPIRFQWYAPARIVESINQYRKKNGYAGLTLEEYILKMHGITTEQTN